MAFAVSSVIAAVGVGVAAYGTYSSISAQKDAAEQNAQAAAKQGEIAQLQAGNVDIQKQQLNLSTQQQQLQIETQKSVIAQQAQADELRNQASILDATRKRRDVIRQGIVANATSLTNATNQGAAGPGSTALAQSANDISGQSGVNLTGINQNLELGQKLFAINKNISSIYLNAQDQNASYVAQGKALQDSVLDTQKQIYSLGGEISQNYSNAATSAGNAAIGAGLTSLGTSVANAYPTLNRITNYFGASSSSSGNNYGYTASTYGNGQT